MSQDRPAASARRFRKEPDHATLRQGAEPGITAALRAYAEEKLSRLTRYLENIVSINVVLSVEKHRQITESHVAGAGSDDPGGGGGRRPVLVH
jgi:hypothetical protein